MNAPQILSVNAQPALSKSITTSITTQVIDSFEGMQALSAEWLDLLSRYEGRNLFLTPVWNRAWWKAFGADKKLRVFVFRAGGRLVGVLPCMRHTLRLKGLPVRVLGSFSNPHTSRTDLIVEPGFEQVVAQALASALDEASGEWDMALLQQLPGDAKWLPHFMQAVAASGLPMNGPTEGIGKCYLPLTQTWDAYLEARGGHFRRNIGKTERRLERAGAVNYIHSIDPAADARDFKVFADVEARSWKGDAGDAHLGAEGWAFQREFATAYDEGITCDNWIVELDGKPVCIVHTVAYDRVSYCFQTLYDQAARDTYVGRAAVTKHFEHVFDSGRYDVLDLNGNSEFCKSWSETERSFVSLQLFNKRLYSRLLRTLRQLAKGGDK